MVEQYLPNKIETYCINFSQTFCKLNTPFLCQALTGRYSTAHRHECAPFLPVAACDLSDRIVPACEGAFSSQKNFTSKLVPFHLDTYVWSTKYN